MNYEFPTTNAGCSVVRSRTTSINHFRSHRGDGQLTIDEIFVTALACRVKAAGRQVLVTAETGRPSIAARTPAATSLLLEALNNLPRLVARAAVKPAMTTVATWAAELVNDRKLHGLLPALTPVSV